MEVLDWTIPVINGNGISHGFGDWGGTSGCLKGGSRIWHTGGKDYNPIGCQIDLSIMSGYSGKTNTGGMFYTQHYQINWYIKRRNISS